MKKITAIILLLAINLTWAQEIPLDPSVRYGKLDNGLTYYIKKNDKPEDKVELRLAINAGSILEDEDQQGLAHFMEHMNFNGTKNFPKNELIDYLQSIGVKFGQHLNAYTGFDQTVYILPIPLDKPDNLKTGLQILEDWAFNAVLTDEEIDKERGVVLEELRLGLGPDKRMLDEYLPKVLYNSQYAKRLPIGKKDILENFDYDAIRRFHRDWYRPDLMAVMVVGDIDVDEIEKTIKKNFGKYKNPNNPRERKEFEVPNTDETLIAVASDPDASFSQVQLYYKDPNPVKHLKTEADYKEMLQRRLFSIMINNRLREIADNPNPPFTYAYSYYGGTWARTKSAYQSFAMTPEGGQLDALKVLLEENERVMKYGFKASEFERAKTELLSSIEKLYNDRDKTESRYLVGEYINNFLEKEAAPGIAWEYEKINEWLPKISLDQVNQLIKKYVREDNRVVVITGPDKETIKQPSEQEVLAVLDAASKQQIEDYNDEVAIAELVPDFKSKGKIKKRKENKELGTTTWELSNGAKVTFKKTDFKNDEIEFAAYSLGGSSLISNKDLPKVQWGFQAMDEAGLNGYSKTDLSKYMTGKQVSVYPYVGETAEGMRGSSTPKDLKTMFEMIYSYFTGLNYDQEAYQTFVDKQMAIMGNITSNPQYYFLIKSAEFMNKDNPRFNGAIPLENEWKNTDFKLAHQRFMERFEDASDFHFYFVGNVDEKQLEELVTQYLASLPSKKGKGEKYVDHGFREPNGQINKEFKKGKDPKSFVAISFQGETKYDPKESIAIDALGNALGIKLVEKLREEESGTYTSRVSGSMSKTPYGSYELSIFFPCGPENVEKLIKVSLDELNKIIENGPTAEDLNKFKEAEVLEFKEKLKENDTWINLMQKAQREGGKVEDYLTYPDKVNALTIADVQAVAKKYCSGDYQQFVLYPEEIVEAPKAEKAEVSVKTVLEGYVQAIGGKDKLMAVKSLKVTQEGNAMGNEIKTTILKMDGKIAQIQYQGGNEFKAVYDGEKAFAKTPQGRQDIPANEAEEMKYEYVMEPLEDKSENYKATVEQMDLDGKSYYVLEKKEDGSKVYYDAETGLKYLVDGPLPGLGMPGKMYFMEYAETKGVKYVKTLKMEIQGFPIELKTTEYLINEGVSDADFK